ncbi:unnamed protein product [Brassica napus]|uniref:HECT-type E3 ubiquitin transferase n=1 Tax=Brassica napus TaxID=3708 RepID=A0A816X339_BRANA|nr:unnamed protein product [Brassica napus]
MLQNSKKRWEGWEKPEGRIALDTTGDSSNQQLNNSVYQRLASEVDPLHLDYFEFTGRVIALALMHKVQVGVLFDRVFFLQLTGKKIGLEDIKNTDRIMYNSCKQILEMDPECFDSDAGLGLTFVSETEVLGKRETKELLKDGKSIAVTGNNTSIY